MDTSPTSPDLARTSPVGEVVRGDFDLASSPRPLGRGEVRSGRPGPEERSDTATSPDESWARWDAEALAHPGTDTSDDREANRG